MFKNIKTITMKKIKLGKYKIKKKMVNFNIYKKSSFKDLQYQLFFFY